MLGPHKPNSRCQESRVESGTTTRNGPYKWCVWNKYDKKDIVWIVLPEILKIDYVF